MMISVSISEPRSQISARRPFSLDRQCFDDVSNLAVKIVMSWSTSMPIYLTLLEKTLKMATVGKQEIVLAVFKAQCRGVKFYDRADCCALSGVRVVFVRNPWNFKDKNCVETLLASSGEKLGHVAAEVAKSLSPMLLGSFNISG